MLAAVILALAVAGYAAVTANHADRHGGDASSSPGHTRSVTAALPSHQTVQLDAKCSPGEVATGGGYFTTAVTPDIQVIDSFPQTDGRRNVDPGTATAWHVFFANASADTVTVGAVALCSGAPVPRTRGPAPPTRAPAPLTTAPTTAPATTAPATTAPATTASTPPTTRAPRR